MPVASLCLLEGNEIMDGLLMQTTGVNSVQLLSKVTMKTNTHFDNKNANRNKYSNNNGKNNVK